MQNNYVQEPPTSGKIILKTTHGDIDIELWTKETPNTCRNFIQLCMEGYYDNCIFHRLIPGFMVQTGDPTGSGKGGESIYGKHFDDEFHSRLKFSQRGRVGMANESSPNTNGSQFFITFDSCNFLEKQNTIFGKVVGDTIFNVLNIQSLDTNCDDKPLDPPKIISTTVVLNPFEDITVRNILPNKINQQIKDNNNNDEDEDADDEDDDGEENRKLKKQQQQELINKFKQKNKKAQKKQMKQLLSFEDNFGDEEIEKQNQELDNQDNQNQKLDQITSKRKAFISSHDILDDPKLSKQPAISLEEIEKKKQEEDKIQLKKKQLKDRIKQLGKDKLQNIEDSSENEISKHKKRKISSEEEEEALKKIELSNFESKELLNKYKTRRNKKTGQLEIYFEEDENNQNQLQEEQDENFNKIKKIIDGSDDDDKEDLMGDDEKIIRQKQKEEYENLTLELLQFKKEKLGTNNQDVIEMKKENKKLLSNLEKRRMKFLENQTVGADQNEKLKKLEELKSRLNSQEIKDNTFHWVNHKLKFHVDSQRAYNQVEARAKVDHEYQI